MSALSEGHLAWGLTRAKHAELDAELSDHLQCLQGTEGAPAAAAARARINSADGRRKLTGPHLAEQVAGTLNRWPTRQEWRELFVLLAWFALIFVSDSVSVMATRLENWSWESWEWGFQPPGGFVVLTTAAWLLQAIARAGFFASFAGSLWRAWQLGRGVCLARILQLKLIHTVLVIAALLALGERLCNIWGDPQAYFVAWPAWLIAPWILTSGVVLALGLLALSRRRWWQLALGVVLTAGFLYPAAPAAAYTVYYTRVLCNERVMGANGVEYYVPSQDRAKLAERAAKYRLQPGAINIDVAANRWTDRSSVVGPLRGHALDQSAYQRAMGQGPKRFNANVYKDIRVEHSNLVTLPLSAPGGGIGWLALPIPILGLIGLTGMALVMGRRSPRDAVLYGTLCLVAIISTILPFFFTTGGAVFDLSPLGVVMTPLPGFESLLVGSSLADSGLLIFGLLLSAGVPWLVTGLFLRPRKSSLPTRGAEVV